MLKVVSSENKIGVKGIIIKAMMVACNWQFLSSTEETCSPSTRWSSRQTSLAQLFAKMTTGKYSILER